MAAMEEKQGEEAAAAHAAVQITDLVNASAAATDFAPAETPSPSVHAFTARDANRSKMKQRPTDLGGVLGLSCICVCRFITETSLF